VKKHLLLLKSVSSGRGLTGLVYQQKLLFRLGATAVEKQAGTLFLLMWWINQEKTPSLPLFEELGAL